MTLKVEVIKILRSKQEEYVSGEFLSKTFNVSRMAINKCIKNLKQEGFVIESSTKKGYKLIEDVKKISKEELSIYLPKERLKLIEVLEKIDSTNNYVKLKAQNGINNGFIAIANEQTKGKGRLGRSFVSLKNKGIYLSICIKINEFAKKLTNITAFSAVAVCKAIEKTIDINTEIKWVNDIQINGKKVCGILTEASIEAESGVVDFLVVGIGINVNENNNDFPLELKNIATSLQLETNKSINKNELCANLIKELDDMVINLTKENNYFEEYKNRCNTIGKNVLVNDFKETKEGFVENLNDDFSLKIRFNEGEIKNISSGEVRIQKLD